MKKLTKSITKSEFINMIGMDTYIHSFKTQVWNVGLVEVSSFSNSKYYNVTIFDKQLKNTESISLEKDGDMGKIIKTKLFD